MLTPRQREVADLVARGLSSKAIAKELGVSVRTVHCHVRQAARRLPGYGAPRFKLLVLRLMRD